MIVDECVPSTQHGRPLVVDIGGEGRYSVAWNVNPRSMVTLGENRGRPIPRHVPGRAEALPFLDGTVDVVIVERTPLRLAAFHEIARIVSENGIVILRHALLPVGDCHALARQILGGELTRRVMPLGNQRLQESVFRLGTAKNAGCHRELLRALGG